MKKSLFAVVVLGCSLTGTFLPAAESSKADLEFFENKIRPIFANNCYKCHSHESTKLKGGLSVEYRDTLLKGGDTGPAIVSGDPEKSLLIKAVRYTDPDLQMPPKGEKLSDEQIADLVNWVKMGAPDPRVLTAVAAKTYGESDRNHWSFKAVKKSTVPEVTGKDWVKTPVDAFIAAKLEENGMKPSPVADKRTLIRRATFDLIGLPPTLKEVDTFLADNSPDAFAKVVDRLLASPQYGERWGRYWLDVARYSDTKGDVKVNKEDFRYPYAWTYRDYVIRSFNEDKPYNRFVLEQIAADKMDLGTNRSSLAALGFLTLGERFNGNINDIINDRIDVVTKGTLGLTVTCARCHDHKFDPIPQKDYYSLHGIFASSVEPSEDQQPLLSKINFTPDYNDFAKQYNTLNQELAGLEASKKGKGKKNNKDVKKEEIQLRREISQLEMTHPGAPVRAMTLVDKARPSDSHVFIRGEAENQGDLVPRRFLEIIGGPNRPVFKNGSGRLELAFSIITTNNPLTARVLVNRVWLHHFGEGFVTTPDDFGNQSAPPSNPELLDYLAVRFMEDGWSIKKLHRLIMLSSVYQQSSDNNPRYAIKDPNNHLLWRANIRRLEFEAVRDSLLYIGGKLDLTMGGRPVNLGAAPYSVRRTVYGYVDRRNLPEVYNQFDFANPDIETGKRYETIVPQQALFMMNSPLVVEQARNVVNLPDFLNLRDDEKRIKLLYNIVYQRDPSAIEIKLGLRFLDDSPPAETPDVAALREDVKEQRKQKGGGGKKKTGPAMSLANIPPSQLRPVGSWAKYAHALLQANEAMFIN
ncbi:PSD1 and planctomycete cytochrome C domain-containing protein [Pedosphaera parvula]|nr:PSD1 and planctomycete cytochrome C domain-containing protein [Pedosphaera parvula]